jgi:hypothetical protein
MQSIIDTPHTPQAMLMPDQGTTPMRRRTERRTQGDDLGFKRVPAASGSASESPPRALRVISKVRGNNFSRKGPRGVERRVAHAEPRVVRVIRKRVAYIGENRAPPRTF